MIEKSRDNVLPAILGHHVLKTGISAVGHAAAIVKAVGDTGLDLAQHADILREICDVVGFLRICEKLGHGVGQDEGSSSISTIFPVVMAPSHSRT